MPRAAKRGPQQRWQASVSVAAWAYLTGSPRPAEACEIESYLLRYQLGGQPLEARALWASAGGSVMLQWIQTHPGTRPHGWWMAEAPEPRQQVGGRAVGWVFLRGGDQWREQEGLRAGVHWQGVGHGAVQFEGMGTYLDRIDGWAAGERDRAPAWVWDMVEVPGLDIGRQTT
jgi:hypothetical protein